VRDRRDTEPARAAAVAVGHRDGALLVPRVHQAHAVDVGELDEEVEVAVAHHAEDDLDAGVSERGGKILVDALHGLASCRAAPPTTMERCCMLF
jgi:hypothetical protein